MTSQPHVLLLGMQFPPARGSGVYRIRGWANHFARRGWAVTVLAADKDYWYQRSGVLDEELEATIDPRVKVVHVKVAREHLVNQVDKMSWAHANFPRLWMKSHQKLREAIFPEVYAPLLPQFIARGAAVHARHRVDLVFATGNPYTQYGAAYELGRLLRRPYVVDYHDPWTLNPLTEDDLYGPNDPQTVWERKIIEHAALTVTVNEPLADWYRRRYPAAASRVRVVENGLAEDVVGEVPWEPMDAARRARPARVGFVGTVRADLPIEEYLDGWALARKEPELAAATMDFYGYLGFFTQNEAKIRERLETGVEGVAYRGPVPQPQLAATYAQLDVLAMLLPSSIYMTAGKGYDYMSAGRPVLGIHDPRNHTTEVFQDYPLFFGVPEVTPEAIRDALVGAVRAARSETREQYEACRNEALKHTWDLNMAPVSAEVEELIRG